MREKKIQHKKIFEYFFSAIIILVVLALIFSFLFYFDVVPTPAFLQGIFHADKSVVDSSYYDENEFYEFLENSKSKDTTIETLHVDVDNVADFIKALNVYDAFYWELDTVDLYDNSFVTSSHSVWAYSGKMRVDTASKFQNTTVVFDGSSTFVRNNNNADVATFEGDTDFTFESAINIADVEFYINSDDTVIQKANLVNTDAEKYLFVSFYNESLDKTDEFYLSLDYGVVLFAESYIGAQKVFTQTTKDFRPNYQPDDEIFKI